jgi:uncharacterized protein YbaR (Trm112 family)
MREFVRFDALSYQIERGEISNLVILPRSRRAIQPIKNRVPNFLSNSARKEEMVMSF